nr:hypothetical protein [Hassallia sp. WJT32-NPBG1]
SVGYGFRLIVPDSNTTASSFKISVVGAGLRCSLFFIYKHPLRGLDAQGAELAESKRSPTPDP